MPKTVHRFFKKKKLEDPAEKKTVITRQAKKLEKKSALESQVFESLSFGTLDREAQSTIYKYVRGNTKPQFSNETLFRKRQSLARALEQRGNWLENINAASFHYLNDTQKTALAQELYFAFYLFSAQDQLDVTEDRRQCLPERGAQRTQCSELLAQLRWSLGSKTLSETNDEVELARAIDDSEKPMKYLGLTLVAPVLVDLTQAFISTGNVKEKMNEINGRRLYWVWGRTFVCTVLDLFSADFHYKSQAEETLAMQGVAMGYISWILYYARAGMYWSLLLKHTIKGPWMNQAEYDMDVTTWERFSTQWDQRKFELLNDTIWATCNLACFYWLISAKALGLWGDVFTLVLLAMDISIAVWQLKEEETKHNATLLHFRTQIETLEDKIDALEHGTDKQSQRLFRHREMVATIDGKKQVLEHTDEEKDELKQQQINVLKEQLMALRQAEDKCKSDWILKQKGFIYDLAYAIGLFAAFSIVCFSVLAAAPAMALILGVVGAGLCFSLNAAYSALKNNLEVEVAQHADTAAITAYQDCLALFLDSPDLHERKRLYLEIQRLEMTSEHQQKVITFQQMTLVHSIIVEALMPAIVFSALVFLPLGLGLVAIAGGIALAVLVYKCIEPYKPEMGELRRFNGPKFLAFEKHAFEDAGKPVPAKPPSPGLFPAPATEGKKGKHTPYDPHIPKYVV